MRSLFNILVIFNAVIFGWPYWFGDRKYMSREDLELFKKPVVFLTSLIIYSPLLIPMYIFKGINYLFNGSQKKETLTSTHQTSHLQLQKPPVVQNPKIQGNKLECPICHNRINSGQKFCTNYGYDLSQQVVVEPTVEK